jgi:hypothetical protein
MVVSALLYTRMLSRRLLTVPLVIAALNSGQALADDPAEPVELGVDVAQCETGAASDDRVVVFRGSMPAAPPASRLAMNFELQERPAGADEFDRVDAAKFGIWQKSAAGASGYVLDKRVEGLAPGAAYRVVVRYRWYAKGGKVLRSAKRTSTLCKQPEAKLMPRGEAR